MSTINAGKKSVRTILSNVEYSIDFYQREFAWKRSHVLELLRDLTEAFSTSYQHDHERVEVRHYPHYFLGTIITATENSQKYIVDGQQRLTSLTLLLIYLHHVALHGDQEIEDVSLMIRSSSFGKQSFNINVEERKTCMLSLFDTGHYDLPDHADLSVRNLVNRYHDIDEGFPESLKGGTLPYFVDWLIQNVEFVEIEAYSGYDAFTIFETMNDRGLGLNPTDLLKGYLLSRIKHEEMRWAHETKAKAETCWRHRIRELYMFREQEDEDQRFIIAWLRGKYATSIRKGRKGATNQDFENIVDFHRWVRDNETALGLIRSQDFYDFITARFDRFAEHYIRMRQASVALTPGFEEIYYNANRNFTLQYMVALAPIRAEDDIETADEKIRLATTFLDIYIARRMVNSRRLTFNSIHDAIFNLARDIRDLEISELKDVLSGKLANMSDTFDGIHYGDNGTFVLNQFTPSYIRYLLARITAWIEQQCGMNTDFNTYMGGPGKSFQIEHIASYRSGIDYWTRQYFGALVLLQQGTNQSFGASKYEDKVKHYIKQNLLAASLHPETYEKNPNFTKFVNRSGLPFEPLERFETTEIRKRQELYRQICEQIWSPDRLNAI